MKAIGAVRSSDTLMKAMRTGREQKASLNDALRAGSVKISLHEDEQRQRLHEKFLHADFDNRRYVT